MSTQALITTDQQQALTATHDFSAFGNISDFENAQRMAKALCSSGIVPETYRGDANLGSCIIALEISNRIGASVLAVMQNLYVVHGKPGWSSQFLISCVNASRKFSPLRYRMTGTKGQDDWGCVAWATDKTGEVLESPEVTIAMSKAEGWYAKNGSKWKTMPELMLRYRTATLFARLYAPELTMGIQTADEIQDVIDVEAVVTSPPLPSFAPAPTTSVLTPPKPEPTPAAPKPRQRAQKTSTQVEAPIAAVQPQPELSVAEPTPAQTAPEAVDLALAAAMQKHGVYGTQVIEFYNVSGNIRVEGQPEVKTIAELPENIKIALAKALNSDNPAIISKLKAIAPV